MASRIEQMLTDLRQRVEAIENTGRTKPENMATKEALGTVEKIAKEARDLVGSVDARDRAIKQLQKDRDRDRRAIERLAKRIEALETAEAEAA